MNEELSVSALPMGAAEWLARRLGQFDLLQAFRLGSRRTGVWAVGARNKRFYFKANRRRVRWGTELYCYRNWVPALRPYAPELIDAGHADGATYLLLTALDGVPLREANLSPAQSVVAYQRAGEVCRRLHDLPCNSWWGTMDELGRPVDDAGDPLPSGCSDAVKYHTQNISNSLATAVQRKAITTREVRCCEGVMRDVEQMRFRHPVPTSFDYTPGNWIVDGAGGFVGAIDFENCGWGLVADPFVRLLVDYFPADPRVEEAFWTGYGHRPSEEDMAQAKIGCVLYGLFYSTMGSQSGNARFVERGRRAFALCRTL